MTNNPDWCRVKQRDSLSIYIPAIYRNLGVHCASTVSSTDGQSQMRFKSPYASSIRETVGQNFFSLSHGTG